LPGAPTIVPNALVSPTTISGFSSNDSAEALLSTTEAVLTGGVDVAGVALVPPPPPHAVSANAAIKPSAAQEIRSRPFIRTVLLEVGDSAAASGQA
jgi:hypothetical protein